MRLAVTIQHKDFHSIKSTTSTLTKRPLTAPLPQLYIHSSSLNGGNKHNSSHITKKTLTNRVHNLQWVQNFLLRLQLTTSAFYNSAPHRNNESIWVMWQQVQVMSDGCFSWHTLWKYAPALSLWVRDSSKTKRSQEWKIIQEVSSQCLLSSWAHNKELEI